MYKLITKDKKTARWTAVKAVESDIIGQHLYNYIAAQPLRLRGAMLQSIAKDYIQMRKESGEGREDAEGELMARLPVDVIADVLDWRLENPGGDEPEGLPLRLLAAFRAHPSPAFRLVWTDDHCPHEHMTLDVIKEDGSGLEQMTFCLPTIALGCENVAEAISDYDKVYGTYLGRLAFRSLYIAKAHAGAFIDAADILNLELEDRL